MDQSELERLLLEVASGDGSPEGCLDDAALDGYPVRALVPTLDGLPHHRVEVARHAVLAWISDLDQQLRLFPSVESDAMAVAKERLQRTRLALGRVLAALHRPDRIVQ